jgi:hypothetical protein
MVILLKNELTVLEHLVFDLLDESHQFFVGDLCFVNAFGNFYKRDLHVTASFFDNSFELKGDFTHALFHRGVPVVLDSVISTTCQHLSDSSPLVSMNSIAQVENPFFIFAPRFSLDDGIEVVVPALTALFADAAG